MSHILYLHDNVTLPNDTTAALATKSYTPFTKSLLADILEKYYSLFLVCFGTIGNGLSLAVLSRKAFRSSPIGIYLRCLALSDLTALYTGCVYFCLNALFDYNIRNADAASCKIHRWLSYTSVDMSSWILVLVTVARLISIVCPLKPICTKSIAYISLTVTFFAALSANLPMLLFYGRMKTYSNGDTVCKYYTEYYVFIKTAWSWIVLVKFALIPVVVLIVLNTILCVRVIHSHKQMNNMNKEGNENRERLPTITKLGCFISNWRGKRFKTWIKSLRDTPRNLGISNTDITRVTMASDMPLSVLQSRENVAKIPDAQSQYSSADDITAELIETGDKDTNQYQTNDVAPQGHEKGNGPQTSNETTTPISSSNNKDKRTKQNYSGRFVKKTLNNENQTKTPTLSISLVGDDGVHADGDRHSSKQASGLLSADFVNIAQSKNQQQNSIRAIPYESRNSFTQARNSLQYMKEKGKITFTNINEEDSGISKFECVTDKFPSENNKPGNIDFNRSNNPIFTISSPMSDHDNSQNSSPHSDGDSGMDVICDDQIELYVNDKDYKLCFNSPKSSSSVDNNITLEEPNNKIMDDSQNISQGIIVLQINDTTQDSSSTDSPYKHNNKTDAKNSQPLISTKKSSGSVAETLAAASNRLLTISKRGRKSERQKSHNNQTESKDASITSQSGSSAISSSSRPLSLNVNDAKFSKRSSVGERLSPFHSTGYPTPSRKDSVLSSCSRQSPNTNVGRGRTSGKTQNRNLTVTLLVINLVFIICNIPIVIFMTCRSYLFTERGPAYTMEIVSNFTMYTNNAINFILYCLTGTRFRMELRAMMGDVFKLICGWNWKGRGINLNNNNSIMGERSVRKDWGVSEVSRNR